MQSWAAVLVRGCAGLAVMCLGLGWGTRETVPGEKVVGGRMDVSLSNLHIRPKH